MRETIDFSEMPEEKVIDNLKLICEGKLKVKEITSASSFTAPMLKLLVQIIQTSDTLVSLDLLGFAVDEDFLQIALPALAKSKSLRKINLIQIPADKKQWLQVFDTLNQNQQLTHLCLAQNIVLGEFSNIPLKLSNLKKLDIASCHIENSLDFQELCANNPSLLSLDISQNNLDKIGVERFLKAASSIHIEKLDISYQLPFLNESLDIIIANVTQSKSLKKITLVSESFVLCQKDLNKERILAKYQENTVIARLNSQCINDSFDPKNFLKPCDVLDLSYNCLSINGIKNIAKLIKDTKIQALYLEENFIQEQDLEELVDIFTPCKNLLEIRIIDPMLQILEKKLNTTLIKNLPSSNLELGKAKLYIPEVQNKY